ncbi:hypothetical protein NEH16_01145 [Streptomyces drozdowiczii]|uniref:Transposase n=1 Tax=Streptomyces drozdowiczii TaxID=202862 RepID=A0ABY6PL01_9ACTN|nr:hypothetical protein [Streptomyces drozdowiczii]UZK52903.1 hypothetical protein NEH16_01145 [Streptomyces drozdowiczii]
MNNADSASQSVRTMYAERFATDLTDNRAEQKELTAQIERLRGRLEQLRADETWLTGMQAALPGETAPHGRAAHRAPGRSRPKVTPPPAPPSRAPGPPGARRRGRPGPGPAAGRRPPPRPLPCTSSSAA